MDEVDDDDVPLVFRRSSTTSKQNHLHSETTKSSSQRHDVQLKKQVSEVRSSNGLNSISQKGMPVLSSKASIVKSHAASPKESTSSAKGSAVKSSLPSPKTSVSSAKASLVKKPVADLKVSTLVADQSNHMSQQNTSSAITKEKQMINCSGEPHSDSEDLEDNKPLSARLSAGLPKVCPNNTNKEPNTSTLGSPPLETPRVKGEDSDDEIPLSSKYKFKSNAGPSGSKSHVFDENKPVAPKLKQNGSTMIDNQVKKSSTLLNKRSVAEAKSLSQPSNKRPKLVNGSSPTSEKVSVKAESKLDEDRIDYVPISERLQMALLSGKKSLSQSSVKRPKLADGSPPIVGKQVSIKAEPKVDENGTGYVPISERLQMAILSGRKSLSQSSVKRPKLVDGSAPIVDKQVSIKAESEVDEDDDDYVPISERLKKANVSGTKSASVKQKVTKVVSTSFKKSTKSKKVVKKSAHSKSSKVPPGSGEGQKWTTFVHNGVIFPPPYKPHGVKMLYKGQPVNLTPEQEEVATMFAVMLDTEYMTKSKFKENFMSDWKKILGKNHVIQRLEDCDFTPIYDWHQKEKEKKKQMSAEEKKALREEKMQQEEKYMWAIVDGVKEKVGNFRVEPPGLFRGRGEHPKMGKLKKRIRPRDITINIGKDAPIPECPMPGERWKEIRHDNTVTWLAFWIDPINSKEFKYVFLAPSSSLKGQSDKEKYEKARLLKDYIQGIRSAYKKDFASKDITKRQIAVATYLIDKLALRAGNEKDDEEADTVGCCTLKVGNVEPMPPDTLKFDFLGKDSIRYQNEVKVELPVFKAIQQFRTGKSGGDDLFDKLDTGKLNAHLKELMPGLTAKVFRTYNASITLDEMLSKETKDGDLAEKVVVYQHANKEVAIICNHQRTVSKSHSAQMSRLNEKIDELKGILDELETDLARAKKGKPPLKTSDGKSKKNLNPEVLERKIVQTNARIAKMERDKETKEDLKTVALGTSKINYLDPRITVAWCKRHEVPIEKIFNKSLLEKFTWAMEVDPNFRF
ncbi:DNA topoisomerase 1-like isoform X1 [Rhododendron vialii]|uniref:DNA topoisomerase 1-like isoform X1 n=1 Tax=Rhododendron vialii TaxID=182163 RepID=UPI00265E36B2|nr:DNA topoisomerase 1-like isoform X1 [Rhododendron vialii]